MAYIRANQGSYGGLSGIWGRGTLPQITIPTQPSGSFIIPSRADPYWGYPAGRPYVGMRPPPPLFGTSNIPFPMVIESNIQSEFYPRIRSNTPSPALYELWDARKKSGRRN